MTFTEAVYLGAIVEAVLFFAAGYYLRASKEPKPAAAVVPNQPELAVDELVRELEREQALRRQHEHTIAQLHQLVGHGQAR